MIKLSSVNEAKIYTSQLVVHPYQSGSNSVDYTFNHNLGLYIDQIEVLVVFDGFISHAIYPDLRYTSTTTLGWLVNQQPTKNSIIIRCYQLGGGDRNIYIRAMAYNTPHPEYGD